MHADEWRRTSAFIGGFKELSLFHFSLSTMPPDTHLACAGCDETLGTLEACAPRKAYASDLTKHRPSQCSSVLLTRKSFAGRKGFFFSLLRLCCSVFIGGCFFFSAPLNQLSISVITRPPISVSFLY